MCFRPEVGETRNIRVEKCSEEPLGIQIESGSNCGIFVSSVSDNSLANKAGIQIRDQLLEVGHSFNIIISILCSAKSI